MSVGEILLVVFGASGIAGAIGVVVKCIFDRKAVELDNKRQISRQMTAKIHEYSEKYYLSIIRSAAGFEASLREEISDVDDPEMLVAFSCLARYFSTDYMLTKQMEGVFLADLLAEVILQRLLTRAFDTIVSEPTVYLSLSDLSQVRREADPGELLVDFKPKLDNEPLRSIFKKYASWRVARKEQVLEVADYLRAYHKLFLYEVNNCYRQWYGRAPLIKLDADKVIIRRELDSLKDEALIGEKDAQEFLTSRHYNPFPCARSS